jgi:hypothetical protein
MNPAFFNQINLLNNLPFAATGQQINLQQTKQPHADIITNQRFNSNFSVNNLLNQQPPAQTPAQQLNSNFTSLFTQQLAVAVANYRLQAQQQQQPNLINNQSAFHNPYKRQKIVNDTNNSETSLSDIELAQNNTSISSSISSPSSTTSSSNPNSNAIDFLSKMNSSQNQNLWMHHNRQLDSGMHTSSSNNCSSSSSSSSSSISASSFNESDSNCNFNSNETRILSPDLLLASTPASYYSTYLRSLSSNFIL